MNTSFVLATAACITLTGCFFPETFTAKISFENDASYFVDFGGKVAYIPAVLQMASTKHSLTAAEDATIQDQVKSFKQNPDIKLMYIGNGRYDVDAKLKQPPRSKLDLLGVISVTTGKDGVVTVASPMIDAATRKSMMDSGLSVNGKLEVVLPNNAVVLSSNATSRPKFFGLYGGYSWDIGNIGTRPVLTFKLPFTSSRP